MTHKKSLELRGKSPPQAGGLLACKTTLEVGRICETIIVNKNTNAQTHSNLKSAVPRLLHSLCCSSCCGPLSGLFLLSLWLSQKHPTLAGSYWLYPSLPLPGSCTTVNMKLDIWRRSVQDKLSELPKSSEINVKMIHC